MAGVALYLRFSLYIIFHDTNFIIGDLPCKSQSCAMLCGLCANVVPEEINYQYGENSVTVIK